MANAGEEQTQTAAQPDVAAAPDAHDSHCFVVMPYGRNATEQRWFAGWFEAVIRPAIETCGLVAVLAAAEEQPAAINDEIRAHLVFDPMVVVDLGGFTADEPPNPNVMYELGIRHAFGLPVVILGWENQRLPFDVGNQRAILTPRDFLGIEDTKKKLVAFIKAAQSGKYYNPMKAVSREAAIDTTSLVLGEDSMLGALAEEVRELRRSIRTTPAQPEHSFPPLPFSVGDSLTITARAELWPIAQRVGYDPVTWGRFIRSPPSSTTRIEMSRWTIKEWEGYLLLVLPQMKSEKTAIEDPHREAVLLRVLQHLPPQPWPSGTHKLVAERTGLTNGQVNSAVKELIRRGVVFDQAEGVVLRSPRANLKRS